jgi:hypothetical protein
MSHGYEIPSAKLAQHFASPLRVPLTLLTTDWIVLLLKQLATELPARGEFEAGTYCAKAAARLTETP